MLRIRLEPVSSFGPRQDHVATGIVVEADYDAIVKAAQNKLQLRTKVLGKIVLRGHDIPS